MWATVLLIALPLQARAEAPPEDLQATIQAEIHERWKSDFAKRSPGRKVALADRLAEAAQSEPDASFRFVLTLEELRLLADAGEIDRAIQAAARLEKGYSQSSAHLFLGEAFSEWLRFEGAKRQDSATVLTSLAKLEIEHLEAPSNWSALGMAWEALGERCPRRSRASAARRAHRYLSQAIPKALDPVKAAPSGVDLMAALRRCETDIHASDRKARAFTLLAGHWIVRGKDGSVGAYEFNQRGDILAATFIDANAEVVMGQSAPGVKAPKLPRVRHTKERPIFASGLQGPSADRRLQHLWIDEGSLLLETFTARGKGPEQWSRSYVGTRAGHDQATALRVAHADVALRRGRVDLCHRILASSKREPAVPSAGAPRHLARVRASVAVVEFARLSLGKKVGNGECSTLAEESLRSAGATWPGGYRFGKEIVDLSELRGGDILQFEGVRIEPGDGSFFTFPHHTAIVDQVERSGAVTLLHQNYGSGPKLVQKLTISLAAIRAGTVTAFRPTPGA